MLKIAVIGVGYWGPNLVRNLLSMPDVELVGICDLSRSALDKMRILYPDVPLFTSFDTLVGQSHPDGIIVATPASTHYEVVKRALDHNISALVEKPLAINSQQACELVELAKKRNLTLMAGHTFLYSDYVRKVKEIINTGELGEIFYSYSQRSGLGQIRQDVDALWNLAPHDISIYNYWFDSVPDRVAAWGFCHLQQDAGIADIVFGRLEYPGNINVHLHLSWLDPQKVRRMIVVGSNKMLSYDDTNRTDTIQVFDKCADRVPMDTNDPSKTRLCTREGKTVTCPVPYREPLYIEIEHFKDCIINKTTPLTDGNHAIGVISVLEALSKSMIMNGKCIDVIK